MTDEDLVRRLELADTHNAGWARDYKSLSAKLDAADMRIAELEDENRRALDQMDTETARANGYLEVTQQLGRQVEALEYGVRYALDKLDGEYWTGDESVLRRALAAVRAPEPPPQDTDKQGES